MKYPVLTETRMVMHLMHRSGRHARHMILNAALRYGACHVHTLVCGDQTVTRLPVTDLEIAWPMHGKEGCTVQTQLSRKIYALAPGWRGATLIMSTVPTVDWVLLGSGESNKG